ncbi:DUF6141 family protein [Methanosarcina sp.]|uniref:DUF6141 family protein n=1 Tax=Methanosarcina sp. TaxID=2213 RepID=UPI003C7386DE
MEQPKTCVIYREVQDLHNNFFLVSVLYPALLLWYIEIHSLVFGKPSGVHNVPGTYLFVLWVIFGLFFPLVFYCTKHITEVRSDGIYIRLIPLDLSFKKIPFHIVEECKIKVYDPLTGKESDVLQASKKVNPVVTLKLISGERMLISSRKPEELCSAIKQAAAQY